MRGWCAFSESLKHISSEETPGPFPGGGESTEAAASLGSRAAAGPDGAPGQSARPTLSRRPIGKISSLARAARGLTCTLLRDAAAVCFPAECRLCEQPLLDEIRMPVCAGCLADLKPQPGVLCALCGERLEADFETDRFRNAARTDQATCDLCRRASPSFARATAFGEYEGALRDLLHLLKYDGVTTLAQPLGACLAESIAMLESQLEQDRHETWLVVPVPLAKGKQRRRGANQAELLAGAAVSVWARSGRRPGLVLAPGVLERTRETESQFGLTPHQRRLNVRGSFALGKGADVRGRPVLLVDDIYTTGATARACSEVLRRAGAATVLVATLARAQREGAALWDGAIGDYAEFGRLEAAAT